MSSHTPAESASQATLSDRDIIANADAAGTTYKLARRWKTTCIVLGVLCCLLIVLIPLGVIMFILAGKARMTVTDEALVVRWIGTRVLRWEDFEAFKQQPFHMVGGVGGLGLAGAVALGAAKGVAASFVSGPVSYKLKSKRMWGNLAVHWHERSGELAGAIEERTGLSIRAK